MENKYNKIFGLLLETIQYPVVILDSSNTIIHINKNMVETFGDITGHNRELLFSDTEENKVALEIIDNNASGRVDVVLADVTYKAIFNQLSAEEDLYTVLLLEDISERKALQTKVEAQLKEMKKETAIAKNIQHSVLPDDATYWNCISIKGIYLPASDIGGDVYDIVRINEDEFIIYISDVSGHGIQASLLTMYMRENVRAKAYVAEHGLDLFMKEILEDYIALDIDAMLYITLLCCKYNKRTNELSFVNAGHNCPPLVLRSNGRVEEIPLKGMPLSIISDPNSYQEEIIGMYPGDRIVLYTDGIVEEYSKAEKRSFGPEGLRKVAEEFYSVEAKQLATTIIEEAAKYMNLAAKDDRTIVIADIL